MKARNSPGGSNFVTLAQLCLVALYDFWNDYFRSEYVIAKGGLQRDESYAETIKQRLRTHASYDLWGDIKNLRVSRVHNQGTATKDGSAFP